MWGPEPFYRLPGGDKVIAAAKDRRLRLYQVPRLTSPTGRRTEIPLTAMNLAGFLWYQGCSNAGRPDAYRRLERIQIDAWRARSTRVTIPTSIRVTSGRSRSVWCTRRFGSNTGAPGVCRVRAGSPSRASSTVIRAIRRRRTSTAGATVCRFSRSPSRLGPVRIRADDGVNPQPNARALRSSRFSPSKFDIICGH